MEVIILKGTLEVIILKGTLGEHHSEGDIG